jgi:hypothetical protein
MKARGLSRIINCLGVRAREGPGRRTLPMLAWDKLFSGQPRFGWVWCKCYLNRTPSLGQIYAMFRESSSCAGHDAYNVTSVEL